jgi:hypothetical protein
VSDTDLLERLRTELPRLLREHPEVRHELWGLMLEAFPSRQEFLEVLRELRAFREETAQRFEAMDRRFEAIDRRFEGVIAELREQRLHLAALGGRVGRGLESVVKSVVEEFAGTSFPSAERLVLVDSDGELFGVPGAAVEFDLYAHNGAAYLVEVKSHLKPNDVLMFHRKAAFAEARIGRPVTRLVLALSMEPTAETLLQRLGIRYRVRAILD